MALKPTRTILDENIAYAMFHTGTRGGVVCASGNVTGTSLDSSSRACEYAPDASGKLPLGVLLTDVVNIDESRQHVNQHKLEVQVGNKVTIVTKGRVVTNTIATGQASGITFPANAYVGLNGLLYTAAAYNTASGYPLVGRFLTGTDTDGYAELQVDL